MTSQELLRCDAHTAEAIAARSIGDKTRVARANRRSVVVVVDVIGGEDERSDHHLRVGEVAEIGRLASVHGLKDLELNLHGAVGDQQNRGGVVVDALVAHPPALSQSGAND